MIALRKQQKEFINHLYFQFHKPLYLGLDPLKMVHGFNASRDREIAGFMAAALAYGKVETICSSLEKLWSIIGCSPYEFTLNTTFATKKRLFNGFRHRFNTGLDIAIALETIKMAIAEHATLESLFIKDLDRDSNIKNALAAFVAALKNYVIQFCADYTHNFDYLVSSPNDGSACKRMNMFLRWMVRDNDGIDLGIWSGVKKSQLVIPVDTHIARIAIQLNLTDRKTPDWKMAEQITEQLKKIDPADPVRFDFSLCRAGMVSSRKGS